MLGWHTKWNIYVLAEMSTDTSPSIQQVSINSSKKDPFTHLLEEFPTLTTPCTSDTPVKHGVTHHIVTEGPPVFGRSHRLSPKKLGAAKAE